MKTATILGWLCAGLANFSPAWSQLYPARAIKVIVPMQAGTAGDTVMRIVTQKMASNIGQPLVIENMPAAAGFTGEERVARSLADGYTIGAMGDSMLTVMPHLQTHTGFDPLRDFEPVSLVASITSVMVLHPSMAATSVREFIVLAKSHPAALDYASGGIGSQQHMAMELFMVAAGIRLNRIGVRIAGFRACALGGNLCAQGYAIGGD